MQNFVSKRLKHEINATAVVCFLYGGQILEILWSYIWIKGVNKDLSLLPKQNTDFSEYRNWNINKFLFHKSIYYMARLLNVSEWDHALVRVRFILL